VHPVSLQIISSLPFLPDHSFLVYLAAVLEYLAAEILELEVSYPLPFPHLLSLPADAHTLSRYAARNNKKHRIVPAVKCAQGQCRTIHPTQSKSFPSSSTTSCSLTTRSFLASTIQKDGQEV
jgi:hypothetical protein